MHGVCAVSSDEGPCARHASRALRRACGQGAVLSLCMVRPGSGRFGVGFWVGFWVGLRARDFPTERVLSRTPLIIRTVDQREENPKTSQEKTSSTFFAGLHERAILPEATGRCKKLDQTRLGGSESLYGSAWFGSVWGGILGGIARAGFSHRESALPDPLNY